MNSHKIFWFLQRALQLSNVLKEIARSEKFANFDIFYMDFPLRQSKLVFYLVFLTKHLLKFWPAGMLLLFWLCTRRAVQSARLGDSAVRAAVSLMSASPGFHAWGNQAPFLRQNPTTTSGSTASPLVPAASTHNPSDAQHTSHFLLGSKVTRTTDVPLLRKPPACPLQLLRLMKKKKWNLKLYWSVRFGFIF